MVYTVVTISIISTRDMVCMVYWEWDTGKLRMAGYNKNGLIPFLIPAQNVHTTFSYTLSMVDRSTDFPPDVTFFIPCLTSQACLIKR